MQFLACINRSIQLIQPPWSRLALNNRSNDNSWFRVDEPSKPIVLVPIVESTTRLFRLIYSRKPSDLSACYPQYRWITPIAERRISAFISNDSIAAGRSIDRSQSLDPASGSGSRIGEIRWRDFFGGGRSPRGRQARNLQVKRFRFGRGSRSRRDDSAQWKRNTTRSVSCESFPGPHARTRTKGTAYTCDWWSSRSPRFNFTGIHRRNDFVSCCGGVLIDFSIIDNATLPTRRSLIAQLYDIVCVYIYMYKIEVSFVRCTKVDDRMCFGFRSFEVK